MSHRNDVRGVRDDLDRLLADPTADEAGLAARLRLLRSTAQGPPPEPTPALRRLLEHGAPAVVPIRSRLAAQAAVVERRRRAVRAGFAGLGVGVKVALVAGAAAAVTGVAVVDPVPDVIREPTRAVITQLGDVVAPWGRGARDGTGRGQGGDRGDRGDPSDGTGGSGQGSRSGQGSGTGQGKGVNDIDLDGRGAGGEDVDRPGAGTGADGAGRPGTSGGAPSSGAGGRGADARDGSPQGQEDSGSGMPGVDQPGAEGGAGSERGTPEQVRDGAVPDRGGERAPTSSVPGSSGSGAFLGPTGADPGRLVGPTP